MSQIIIKCATCGKTWQGKSEYEVEGKIETNPCKCKLEAQKMSMDELLAKIKETT